MVRVRRDELAAPIVAAAYAINGGPVNYAANVYSQATALNDVTAGFERGLRNLPLHSRGRI